MQHLRWDRSPQLCRCRDLAAARRHSSTEPFPQTPPVGSTHDVRGDCLHVLRMVGDQTRNRHVPSIATWQAHVHAPFLHAPIHRGPPEPIGHPDRALDPAFLNPTQHSQWGPLCVIRTNQTSQCHHSPIHRAKPWSTAIHFLQCRCRSICCRTT